MVWASRLTAVALTTALFFGMAPPGVASEPPAVYFSESFEAGLDAWWAEPGWSTTDNRAHSGRSAFFGDDQGTPTPDDNNIDFCYGTICQRELRSPSFDLPNGPAHLYYWLHLGVTGFYGPPFRVEVERMSEGSPLERTVVSEPAPIRGWVFHVDLSPFAGETLRLVFTADPGHPHSWDEAIYLDEVVVTDRLVPTETVERTSDPSPAVAVSFQGATDVRSFIKVTIEGQYVGPSLGVLSALRHDDVGIPWYGLVFSGGSWAHARIVDLDPQNWTYGIGAEVSLQALGTPLVGEEVSVGITPGGAVRLTATLQPALFPKSISGWAVVLLGVTDTVVTTTYHVQDGVTPFSVAYGGSALAVAFPREFNATFVSTIGGQMVAMLDASFERIASGPAMAWFPAFAGVMNGLSMTSPSGPVGESRLGYSESPGAWRIRVDSAANGLDRPYPWAIIGELPPFPLPRMMEGPDLADIPKASVPSGTADHEQVRSWSVSMPMGCAMVAFGHTLPAGCHLHPLFLSMDTFRIASRADLKSMGFSIDTHTIFPWDVADIAHEYCLRLVAPAEIATEACAARGESVTLLETDEGHLLANEEVLQFQMRLGGDHGAVLVQGWTVHLTLQYGEP